MTANLKTTFRIGGQLEINRFGYGAMQLTGPGVFGDAPDRTKAKHLLMAAIENGVNFIDTADAYGPHTNETLIAETLSPYKKGLVIATKGGLTRPGPDAWTPNGNPEYIRQCIDGSLKRLKREQIDLWQLHRIDPAFPVEETLRPVADAVKAGKIRFVGLSEVNVAQIEKAEKIVPIVSVQNQYNLQDRQWESVVDYTQKRGMAFIPWFPLSSGPDAYAGKIQQIANQHKASKAQIALAWLMKRSDNILLIPGTSSIPHLVENLKAQSIQLTEKEFSDLK